MISIASFQRAGCAIIMLFLFLAVSVSAQKTITGKVVDGESGEPLPGATVSVSVDKGTSTDPYGHFIITISDKDSLLEIRYVGYQTLQLKIKEQPEFSSDRVWVIQLTPATNMLDITVVTASRSNEKPETATVTVDVLPPAQLNNRPVLSTEETVSRIPGLHVIDGQANIRGGSGFSYGAGSRVLLLVDDIPMISADAGDVKWNFLPMESLERVEVIKGASSALYGSSALNGVIHLRTIQPTDTPMTRMMAWGGMYGNPVRIDSTGKSSQLLKWWDGRAPALYGAHAVHARKWNDMDWVICANGTADEGYREGEMERRFRVSASVRQYLGKDDRWTWGTRVSAMWIESRLFLLWMNADSGAWKPFGGIDPATTTLNWYSGSRWALDPYVIYRSENGGKHALRNRLYMVVNNSRTGQGAKSYVQYHEYQYQKNLNEFWMLNAGAVLSRQQVRSELYGDHHGVNAAVYGQVDRKGERTRWSVGLRFEHFRVDTAITRSSVTIPSALSFDRNTSFVSREKVLISRSPVKPVLRLGVNRRFGKATFIRASYGGGYRFPSVAEKFVSTEVGGLKIFPNPDLQPETGWSAEAGIRQIFKKGKVSGFVDVALFLTEYQNMMEFTFGQYYPPSITNPDLNQYLQYSGFRSENVGNARISGTDVSAYISGKIRKVTWSLWTGYTLANGSNINPDSTYLETLSDPESSLLKYRFKHLFKAETQVKWRHFSWGVQTVFHSYMENVDKSFEEPLLGNIASTKLLPGLKEYRDLNNTGPWVWEARWQWDITRKWTTIISVRNLFNKEYMERPGDIQPSRTMLIHLKLAF
ncbi:MAG: TonB-dependent receptor [Flavobacteriales bacterium]|nr:TonB-dependent receptor [Flavobacteriales bacterium]